eukprot:7201408-Prymnesium_polylepis.1
MPTPYDRRNTNHISHLTSGIREDRDFASRSARAARGRAASILNCAASLSCLQIGDVIRIADRMRWPRSS